MAKVFEKQAHPNEAEKLSDRWDLKEKKVVPDPSMRLDEEEARTASTTNSAINNARSRFWAHELGITNVNMTEIMNSNFPPHVIEALAAAEVRTRNRRLSESVVSLDSTQGDNASTRTSSTAWSS